MWRNFKSMPTPLKFITIHTLLCFTVFLVAVIPRNSFPLNNRMVSYGEWWDSGMGLFFCVTGLTMTFAGIMFLTRRGIGRYAFLAVFGGSLIVPFLLSHNYLRAAIGAVITAAVWAYLFKNPGVVAYFASNNSFKRTAAPKVE